MTEGTSEFMPRGEAGPGFGPVELGPLLRDGAQPASQQSREAQLEYLGGELDFAISNNDHEAEIALRDQMARLHAEGTAFQPEQ